MKNFVLHPLTYLALAFTVFGLVVVGLVTLDSVLECGLEDPRQIGAIVLFPILAVLSFLTLGSWVQVTSTSVRLRMLWWTAYDIPLDTVHGLISQTIADGLVLDQSRNGTTKRRVLIIPRVLGRRELARLLDPRSSGRSA